MAIATPATYVQDPLRVFRLDFEENLEVMIVQIALLSRYAATDHPVQAVSWT